jgi:hypothetical protein
MRLVTKDYIYVQKAPNRIVQTGALQENRLILNQMKKYIL